MNGYQKEINFQLFLEMSKTAHPDSLFSAPKGVLEALAFGGAKLDRVWEKRGLFANHIKRS